MVAWTNAWRLVLASEQPPPSWYGVASPRALSGFSGTVMVQSSAAGLPAGVVGAGVGRPRWWWNDGVLTGRGSWGRWPKACCMNVVWLDCAAMASPITRPNTTGRTTGNLNLGTALSSPEPARAERVLRRGRRRRCGTAPVVVEWRGAHRARVVGTMAEGLLHECRVARHSCSRP